MGNRLTGVLAFATGITIGLNWIKIRAFFKSRYDGMRIGKKDKKATKAKKAPAAAKKPREVIVPEKVVPEPA